MKIIEINIKHFGKLKDFVLKPGDGVNIVYGKNESGKSTIMAFIKAMFYGLESGEKRMQYEPWSGGQPAGSIEFEHNGSTYFLNRTFGESKGFDRISLFDKTKGENVPLSPGQEPGMLVLGINIKTFVSSVFIGQSGISVDGDNHEMIDRLVNLTSAGDEHVSKREIDKRLKNAVAQLDSKKSDAILPELRKQKRELMDARTEMNKALEDSDKLRDRIEVDMREKKTMREEIAFLNEMQDRLGKREELAEIDAVLRKRDEVAELQEKFDKLDQLFSGELADGMSEFMSSSGKLLDEEKLREAALQEKLDELEELRRQSVTIDRPKLNMTKTVKKYANEIRIAFEQYDSLVKERKELEYAIEHEPEPEQEPEDMRLIGGICIGVMIAALFLGLFAHWIFYLMGLIAVVSVVVYMFIYRKSIDEEDKISESELALSGVTEQMNSLNEEYQPILNEFGVTTMEEFDRLYKAIEQNQKKYIEGREKKLKLETQIAELKARLEDVRKKLQDKLTEYHETESSEEATEIIGKLSGMKREHETLSIKLESAKSAYEFMLRGRSIDSLALYSQQIRSSVELEVPDSFTKESVQSRIALDTSKLEEIEARIANEETELLLMPYNTQNVQKVTDEIRALNRRIEHYEFELSAVEEAQKTLDEAFHEMKIDFGPMINYRASRVLNGMTGSQSGSVLVSDKLIPAYAEHGDSQPRSSELMGAGTYDQIYLSLRIALSGVVADDKMPVMLDDSFARFDDDRMTAALKFLRDDNSMGEIGQVIIFTCHKRIVSAAKKLEMTENVYSM